MVAYKRQAPIPKLDKEEKQELDYGYDKVISYLLKECTNVVLNIDRNKDGSVSEGEYSNSLWQLQILQSAIGSHLDNNFRSRMNKERTEFEKVLGKIQIKKEFTNEEKKLYGLVENSTNYESINKSLLYKRYILIYYRSLFEIASKLKFVRGEVSA